jgi:hypothetical protein
VLPLIVSYLALLWLFASAASRGQGFVFFAAGCVALVVGLAAFRRGRRGVLYGVYLIVLMGASLGMAFELVLHLAPGVLSGHVADVTYTGYHWQKGGIYALDDHMGPDLVPGVQREMYWAGRWWWHAVNSDGYRGPRVERAAAVFLGDSMIYGHGVEEDQTVAARFGVRTGLSVANLGQQGTCQVQSWLRFARIGLKLRPRIVFACSHFTDIEDPLGLYPTDELEKLLASPLDAPYLPFALGRYRPRPWWDPVSFWARRLALPLRCSGVAGAVVRTIRARHSAAVRSGAPPWVRPSEADIDAPFAPFEPGAQYEQKLGWRVHVRSVRQIKRLCDGIGARLVLFDIGYPRAFSSAIEGLAREIGADYDAAGREALACALDGRPIFLPDDGHWTPEGSDVVAASLARLVAQNAGSTGTRGRP